MSRRSTVPTPTSSTTGRITRPKRRNPSPKLEACATRARATMAPDSVDRNMPARLNDSFHASDREASKLQCSVERICSRIAGGMAPPTLDVSYPPVGVGAGSGPTPPPVGRSKDIAGTLLLGPIVGSVRPRRSSVTSFRPRPPQAPGAAAVGDPDAPGQCTVAGDPPG